MRVLPISSVVLTLIASSTVLGLPRLDQRAAVSKRAEHKGTTSSHKPSATKHGSHSAASHKPSSTKHGAPATASHKPTSKGSHPAPKPSKSCSGAQIPPGFLDGGGNTNLPPQQTAICLGHHKPWVNPDETCEDISAVNSSVAWGQFGGAVEVLRFAKSMELDSPACEQCAGKTKAKCSAADPKSKDYDKLCNQGGLKTLAKGRWDRGAARFAGTTSKFDVQCGIQGSACNDPPSCKEGGRGPAPWSIVVSMVQLNTILNRLYSALQDARDQCNTNMIHFSKDFAPVPAASTETIWLGFMSQSIGILAGVAGSFEAPLLSGLLANGILSTLISSGGGYGAYVMNNIVAAASPKSPADTAQFLGVIANKMMNSVESYAESMFKTGKVTWKGGEAHLTDLIGLGNYYSQEDTSKEAAWGALQTIFQRSLYQQLAVYTWQNLEAKSKEDTYQPYAPFITYEKGKCGATSKDLDDKNGFSRDLDRAASQVPRGDWCYYLVQAVDYTNPCTTDCSHINQCTIQNLPGGTHKLLTGKVSVYSGLTVEDFVIPSVEAWLKNGQKNGWKPASALGPVKDIRAAGTTTIPVCDYAYKEDNPGKGCPKFDSKCAKF